MKNNTETMVELSSNDVYEILTRVSLDTLLNEGRWVCKEWRDLTYNSNFRRLHSTRTQSLSGYFLQGMIRNHYYNSFVSFTADQLSHPIDFVSSRPRFPICLDYSKGKYSPPRELKIEASSHQGLLCCVDTCTDHRIPTYYIVKPATREWRQIPNPKTKHFTTNMAMVVRRIKQADNSSNTKLHYKILRLSSYMSRSTTLHCEIFDSSKWSWKRLNDVRLPYGVFLCQKRSVLVHGRFHHWLTNEDFIFVFDMYEETWSSIALPESAQKKLVEYEEDAQRQLVEYEGKLGFLNITRKWVQLEKFGLLKLTKKCVELWVLEEYYTNRWWKKEYCKDLELESHSCLSGLEDVYSSEVALIKDFYSLEWYDLKRDKSTEIKVPSDYMHAESYAFDSDVTQGSLSR